MTEGPERTIAGPAKRLALITLLAGILVALLGVLTPSSSAAPLLHPETRVAAVAEPAGPLVGPHATVLAVQGRERAPNYDRSATGSSVAAEGEPGAWATANESMSERAAAYQEQITGASPGSVYEVNGVKFDGFSDGVLQEAKGPGYGNFVQNGRFADWFTGQDSLVSQARSQLAVAGGTPITWSVAEPQAAEAIQALFADRGIVGINVVYVPPTG